MTSVIHNAGRVILLALVLSTDGCSSWRLADEEVEGNFVAPVPYGWKRVGNSTLDYTVLLDTEVTHGGLLSLTIVANSAPRGAFGGVYQSVAGDAYAGKRVRFSAFCRTKGVAKWTGLWLRADTPAQFGAAFDNMQDRPVRGTNDWQQYEVVLDIPKKTVELSFGILLQRTGQVWMDDARLEVVGPEVSVTRGAGGGKSRYASYTPEGLPEAPRNLDFEGVGTDGLTEE
jgi:hypothetical protein